MRIILRYNHIDPRSYQTPNQGLDGRNGAKADWSINSSTYIHPWRDGKVGCPRPRQTPNFLDLNLFVFFFLISVILFIQGCGGSHVNTWWPVSIVSATPHVLFILLLSNQLHSQRRPTDAMSAPPRRSTTTSYLIFSVKESGQTRGLRGGLFLEWHTMQHYFWTNARMGYTITKYIDTLHILHAAYAHTHAWVLGLNDQPPSPPTISLSSSPIPHPSSAPVRPDANFVTLLILHSYPRSCRYIIERFHLRLVFTRPPPASTHSSTRRLGFLSVQPRWDEIRFSDRNELLLRSAEVRALDMHWYWPSSLFFTGLSLTAKASSLWWVIYNIKRVSV